MDDLALAERLEEFAVSFRTFLTMVNRTVTAGFEFTERCDKIAGQMRKKATAEFPPSISKIHPAKGELFPKPLRKKKAPHSGEAPRRAPTGQVTLADQIRELLMRGPSKGLTTKEICVALHPTQHGSTRGALSSGAKKGYWIKKGNRYLLPVT